GPQSISTPASAICVVAESQASKSCRASSGPSSSRALFAYSRNMYFTVHHLFRPARGAGSCLESNGGPPESTPQPLSGDTTPAPDCRGCGYQYSASLTPATPPHQIVVVVATTTNAHRAGGGWGPVVGYRKWQGLAN